ncbi:MAG TPA: peptidoglycan recognition family protein [Acidobacteriota bacterium]|nr:peptidoglycan recognition family protein [Acidobacteriota bacterium]
MPAEKPLSRVTVAAFESPLRKASLIGTGPKPAHANLPPNLHDIRATAGKEHIIRRRPWKHVTGICLHQTACVLGEKPTRWNNVGCHIGITRSGKIIWLHDFDFAVVHGNGWNSRTVGIEIDGTYEGIEGNDRTFWRPKGSKAKPTPLTQETIDATKAAIQWIYDEVACHDGEVKVLVAHRQASKTRRSDPGSAIWKSIALPMQKELGLGDGGKGFTIGSGLPIPTEWNPAYKGIKY